MDVYQLIATAGILLVASVVQSAVGFGFGLLSLPLMLFAGLPLPLAVMIVCFTSSFQAMLGLRHYWAQVKWREVMIHTAARVFTIPLGVFALGLLVTWRQATIQAFVGFFLLLVLLSQLAFRVEPKKEIHVGWNWLAGGFNGFLSGLIGMGGPPTVLWLAAHRWTSKQTRVFLWAVMTVGFPLLIIPLWIKFGNEVALWALGVGLGGLPLIWLGVRGGIYVGKHLPRRRLRIVALTMLFLIAITSLVRPLLSGMQQAPAPSEERSALSDGAAQTN